MNLGRKQTIFTRRIALLILYAPELGFEIRFDREHCNHIKYSLHYKGLAKDFNLFKGGEYITDGMDHKPLGDFWESMNGCKWGGNFKTTTGTPFIDGNHYSLPHAGFE